MARFLRSLCTVPWPLIAFLLVSIPSNDGRTVNTNTLPKTQSQPRSYQALSTSLINNLTTLTDFEMLDFRDPSSLLSKILVPRPAGSEELKTVMGHVKNEFAKLGAGGSASGGGASSEGTGVPKGSWELSEDNFSQDTPYGNKNFNNLIWSYVPPGQSFSDLTGQTLVLSAHIDSKYSPTGFVGATDSGAPCAILVDLAKALTGWLDEAWEERRRKEEKGEIVEPWVTLQIVMFDGEEAFINWTHDDSIYGSKHLADLWSKPQKPPSSGEPRGSTSPISRISHFVLLDLLGTPNPSIPCYYQETGWFFDQLASAEEKLGLRAEDKERGLWARWEDEEDELEEREEWPRMRAEERQKSSFFIHRVQGQASFYGYVEDDHIPFVHRGVPVVHLIPSPFPRVWHTMADDASALDMPTIKAWSLIMRLVVAEFLGLGGSGSEAARATEVKRDNGELVRFEIGDPVHHG